MIEKEVMQELKKHLAGEIKDDLTTRVLYSTDASIYQIEPFGVVFPQTLDDLNGTMEIARKYQVPIVARGAGSSLVGQAIGRALIVDTSRVLNNIIEIDLEENTAVVEPGVLLTAFNRHVGQYGLTFGPDPASADRATIGGSIGNNATGAHSIMFGMAADHLLEAEVVFADGSQGMLNSISREELNRRAGENGKPASQITAEQSLYRFVRDLRQNHVETIKKSWPKVWRRASGYNLNYMLPWSPSKPPQWVFGEQAPYPPVRDGEVNLAALLAGSEGTLALIRKLKIGLVPKLTNTILGVLTFNSVAEACDAASSLLERKPSAIELIPGGIIELARSVPAYAKQLTFVRGNPAAILVVEFSGSDKEALKRAVQSLSADVLIAETKEQQEQVWGVRKVGFGILNSEAGDVKPVGFIEDVAVPVERLGEYVRELERIFSSHGTYAHFYAHASAGCLHIRPLLNLKDVAGVSAMRAIAEDVMDLSLKLDGTPSGEHGDGLARSEWLERAFGQEIYSLFGDLKNSVDPQNLLNPGKIVNSDVMDENLRYGKDYHPVSWADTVFDFSDQGSLVGAIEMCNGAAVCRKDVGLMCPSFQITQDEMYSPRGRANLLRAMISGKLSVDGTADHIVYEALDLCLACKGCKSECPSAVDIAKLKYEFLYHYYQKHQRKLRDHLFANIDWLAPLANPFAAIVNAVFGIGFVRQLGEGLVGLSAQRRFPAFASLREKAKIKASVTFSPDVLFLNDSFSRDFHPETAVTGIRLLEELGYQVRILPVVGAGRPLFSKGFLDRARKHAVKLVNSIKEIDPDGVLPVVGVEPSEIFSLRDEYLDLFPEDDYVKNLAKRAWMADEFLIRPGKDGVSRMENLKRDEERTAKVLLHGQCYQKVQPLADDGIATGAQATIQMLEAAGYDVEMIESGCCGMAGAFGYEAEHYELSMKIGELAVLPAVRKASQDTIIAASGTSCRSQIKGGTKREGVHPITLV